tara:strand:- start:86068 stop:86664 length:597 start_codon:yes stop_codon:yes gene_type:complete
MYKVFINDKPIILTDSPQIGLGFEVYDFETVVVEEIVHKLKRNKINGVILFCKEINKCWASFLTHFKVITAAGGLVLNQKKEFLFIYRGSKWDLPKGRIEKGESIETTALREVEEECGIPDLQLDEFLLTTYHLFFLKNENRLKETHWFLMHTNYEGKLTPQTEEGITIAEFKSQEDTDEALKKTYANIHLVFETYHR